jgi:succinylglutamate-semialdehyde dehydrogenase
MELETLQCPGNYLDGAFRTPAQPEGELVIQSPADSADVCSVHPYARAALLEAVEGARKAWPSWRRLTIDQRADYLRGYQARLRANHAAITHAIAREVGKPLWEAKTEVDAMIAKVDLTLGEGRRFTEDIQLPDLPGEIRHRPLGVVGVIGPFNFPGHLPNGHIVPALLLGNCVVHKPSEKTPSAGTWMARCFHEAGLPAGVWNLIQGPGEMGAALSTHPDVDGLMFTGSSAVGRRILASQVDRIDRLIALELGGKNASIALDDCDLERTARAVAFSAYVTAGQRCTATSRLIVTRGIARPLIERIASIARQIRVGYPLSPASDAPVFMGPVIDHAARARLLAAQRTARAAGFEAVVPGGEHEVAGHLGPYVRPALHVAPTPTTEVPGYTEVELFGPDLAVYEVESPEDAFTLANRGWSGLTAANFTANRGIFEQAIDQLRVGVLQWNRASAGASSRLPFGGIRDSGNHRPAGIFAGLGCCYALGVQLPATIEAPLTWPGFGV